MYYIKLSNTCLWETLFSNPALLLKTMEKVLREMPLRSRSYCDPALGEPVWQVGVMVMTGLNWARCLGNDLNTKHQLSRKFQGEFYV